jgi:hypothetical protein
MDEYSDEVLEQTPERATKFLSGIGAVPVIRTLLAQAMMGDEDILEGRGLLLDALALPQGPEAVNDTEQARAQRAATAELDQWDEPNFARHRAALHRHFPNQEVYVFHDLSASTGPSAVTGIATFLARLDALEDGTDLHRQATKKEDKKAVQLLASRGLTRAERGRLGALVGVALGPTKALSDAPAPAADTARRQALVKLKDWYEEWSATAKAVVKKKGYLIRLGLASRKRSARKASPQVPST